MELVLGTRGSALALAQVDLTEAALGAARPDIKPRREIFITRGDRKLDLNLLQKGDAGGKGLFTRELEEALLDGRIDVAVHSLKDLPGHNPEGLEIAAVLERAAIGDVLVSKAGGGLDGLPQGATVGTSSIRRARQIAWKRPDVKIEEWRGNVQTRLRKLGERPDVAAIVLAEAGLQRLGLLTRDGKVESQEGVFFADSLANVIIPAIGQGAVALQMRSNRPEIAAILASINHGPTMLAVRAEREVQRLLAGDCSVPVGVRTEFISGGLKLTGILFAPNESTPPQRKARIRNPSPANSAASSSADMADIEALFQENFSAFGEVGASVSVWKDGREILSLAGGWRDRQQTLPWTADTPVLVWSATKGPAAACVLHARTGTRHAGPGDLARVCTGRESSDHSWAGVVASIRTAGARCTVERLRSRLRDSRHRAASAALGAWNGARIRAACAWVSAG
jgi:hydroxymethylbilane synthase